MSKNFWNIIVFIFVIFLLPHYQLNAFPSVHEEECSVLPLGQVNTNGKIKYRVDQSSFDLLPGISRSEGLGAIVLGADTWNEQATSGYFQYMGTAVDNDLTSDFYLPKWDTGTNKCADVNESVVRVYQGCLNGGYAKFFGRCKDLNTLRPKLFEVWIFTQMKNTIKGDYICDDIPWSSGRPLWEKHDIATTMVHEFGHALNLNHPVSNSDDDAIDFTATVMSGHQSGSIWARDLYEWDLKCSKAISGVRNLTEHHMYISSGSISSEYNWFSGVTHVSPGVNKTAGTWNWSSALSKPDLIEWYPREYNSPWYIRVGQTRALTEATLRESPERARLFYPSIFDSLDITKNETFWWQSNHVAMTFFWQEGSEYFAYNSLLHCNTMNSWMNCSCDDTSHVVTSKPLSIAYANGINHSVIVWASQERSKADNFFYDNEKYYSDHNKIKVSIGFIDTYLSDFVLSEPDNLGVRSSVAPAVACGISSLNQYDCMVAYVDDTDGENNVRIKRFNILASQNRYTLVAEDAFWPVRYLHIVVSPIFSVSPMFSYFHCARTASRIALWWNSGAYWLAIRPIAPEQRLEVYKTTDEGETWTAEILPGSGPETAIGPAAVGYWNYSNLLMYAR